MNEGYAVYIFKNYLKEHVQKYLGLYFNLPA